MKLTNIFSNTLINTFLAILSRAVIFFLMITMASKLTSAEYAQFSKLYAFYQFFAGCIAAGFYEYAIYKLYNKEEKHNSIKKLYSHILVSAFFSGCLMFLAINIVLFLYSRNSEAIAFREIFTATVAGFIFSYILLAGKLLRLLHRFVSAAIVQHCSVIAGLIIAYFCFSQINDIHAFFISLSTFAFIILISGLYLVRGHVFFWSGWNLSVHKIQISAARPHFFNSILGWIGGFGNLFIVDFFLDEFAVARYAFLYSLGGGMLLVAGCANQVWSPYFYSLSKNAPQNILTSYSRLYYCALSCALVFFAIVINLAFQPIIRLIGGELLLYQDSLLELSLIFLSYIVYVPVWHYRNVILTSGNGALLFKLSFLASMLGIVASILLIANIGKYGVYISLVCLSVFQVALFHLAVRKNKDYFSILFSVFPAVLIYTALLVLVI